MGATHTLLLKCLCCQSAVSPETATVGHKNALSATRIRHSPQKRHLSKVRLAPSKLAIHVAPGHTLPTQLMKYLHN